MNKEKFLKSRNEWKNFHSAILFSMLNPNHETSSPDVLKDFLDFVKMPEKARNSFLADFDFLEFSTNIKQTILLIKNKKSCLKPVMKMFSGSFPIQFYLDGIF